jgi:hypothetical protein
MKFNTFPAGRYYIGDPCYVVAPDDWIPLLHKTGYLGYEDSPNWNEGVFSYKDEKCFACGTAHGDGVYFDNKSHKYGVDAGLIGILPEKVCTFGQTCSDERDNVHEFTEDFEVWIENNVFHFGNIRIDTN